MLCTRLTNARILTMDPQHPVAHDLGIWRGRVVGVDEAVTSLPAREVVDLGGATVLPGFIDSHVHLAWTGLKAGTPSVAPCERVEDILAVVDAAARRPAPSGAWVDVAGYDQRALGRHLTAAELDRVSHGRKVFLMHDSGHACVVNTAVLELLPDGTPHENGFLAESAMTTARRLRLPYSQEELADAIELAARLASTRGSRPVPRRASAAGSSATAPSSWAPTNCSGTAAACPCGSSSWRPATPCAPAPPMPTTGSPGPWTSACVPGSATTGCPWVR